MKVVVGMDVEADDQDAELIDLLPAAIRVWFAGTLLTVNNIRIMKDDRK